MQGALDDPPLTITKSRPKVALLGLACAAFSAAGFGMWRVDGDSISLMAKAGIVMFTLLCPACLWEVVRPQRLVLSREGLRWVAPWRTHVYRWDELSEFSVYSIRASKLIGFNVIGDAARRSRLSKLNSLLTGANCALPGLWEAPPDVVAGLLNEARSKWAPPPAGDLRTPESEIDI
jgi:hypothetical protein